MSFEQIDLQWFAAEDEGRTELPSEKKLSDARKEGRVAKSQELNSALVMIVTVVVLVFAAPHFLRWCKDVLVFYFSRILESDFLQKNFYAQFIISFAKMVLPVALAGLAAGVIGNLIQNRGFIFSTKPIEPKFSNIVPKIGQYLKKTVFSMEGGFNVAKSLVKVLAVGAVAFLIIRSNIDELLALIKIHSVQVAVGKVGSCAAVILIICAIIFLAVSVPDYFVQRHQFMESLKMTKEEVKTEFKESEGDPEIKAETMRRQRELLQRNVPKAVAESDVVITNPTHFSVALKYDPQTMDYPVVNAKGEDFMAKRIRDLADEYGIPRVENVPLARALYSQTDVGDIIPAEYIKVISVIYAQVYSLKKK